MRAVRFTELYLASPTLAIWIGDYLKYVLVVLIMGLAVASLSYEPITGIQDQHDTPIGVIDEQQKVKAEEKVEKKWEDLTSKEKIKLNPKNCSKEQTIWASDGSCHDKPVVKKVKTTPKAKLAVPGGSCHDWMNQAGVPANLQPDLYALIMRESGCNPGVFNPTSSAGGIPQALPFSKMGCSTSDPVCQIKWMVNYCNVRYGGIPQANAFQLNNNWY